MKPSEKNINIGTFDSGEELVEAVKEQKKALWVDLSFFNIYSIWDGGNPAVCCFIKDYESDRVQLY